MTYLLPSFETHARSRAVPRNPGRQCHKHRHEVPHPDCAPRL